jgi:virulence-associated protein VapD
MNQHLKRKTTMPRNALAKLSTVIQRRARKAYKQLSKLLKEVDKLEARLEALEPLAKTVFTSAAKAKPGRKPGPKSAAAKTVKRATGKSLGEYVAQVLSEAAKGLNIKAIEAAVRKAGYPTMAKNIYNPIMKVLGKGGFEKIEAGVYAAKNAVSSLVKKVAATKTPKAKANKAGAATTTVAASKTSKPKRKKRGQFKETGEQLVLGLLKGKRQTSSELTKAWKSAGRGGKVDNSLGKLVAAGKIKREKLKGKLGSIYTLA